MSNPLSVPAATNTFERIKRVSAEGDEFWSARELARVLEYTDYRNFVAVIAKAREACSKSGHPVADHFVDITEMVGIGSGAQREVEDWALSRYACYLIIQNADPGKPLVALGQTYFAVQSHARARWHNAGKPACGLRLAQPEEQAAAGGRVGHVMADVGIED